MTRPCDGAVAVAMVFTDGRTMNGILLIIFLISALFVVPLWIADLRTRRRRPFTDEEYRQFLERQGLS